MSTTQEIKSVEYFDTIHTLCNSYSDTPASDLARTISAILKVRFPSQKICIAFVGPHDDQDITFFQKQGWKVELFTTSAVTLSENYDIVFSNDYLHFFSQEQREKLLCALKQKTKAGGIHAVAALRDMSNSVDCTKNKLCYLSANEWQEMYADWDFVDHYNGPLSDQEPHKIISSAIIAKPLTSKKTSQSQRALWRNLCLTFSTVALSTLLCTLGYNSLNAVEGSIANVWPGAIFQVVSAIAFGAWGIVATLVAGIITNLINVKSFYFVFAFTPANFVQSFIPAYYYRKHLAKAGWRKSSFAFLPFLIFGVLLPNIFGASLGAFALSFHSENISYAHFFWKWLIANVPIALLLGWPLFYFVIPSFIEEGWTVKGWWK